MVGVTLLALLLYGAVWVVHLLLQVVISLAIEVEERELYRAKGSDTFTHLEKISVLHSLEIVMGAVFTAVLPIVGIVMGAVLPDPARTFLSDMVGSKTVIAVTVAALFAYFSVFRILRKHQGRRVWDALVDLFSGKGRPTLSPEELTGTPSTSARKKQSRREGPPETRTRVSGRRPSGEEVRV